MCGGEGKERGRGRGQGVAHEGVLVAELGEPRWALLGLVRRRAARPPAPGVDGAVVEGGAEHPGRHVLTHRGVGPARAALPAARGAVELGVLADDPPEPLHIGAMQVRGELRRLALLGLLPLLERGHALVVLVAHAALGGGRQPTGGAERILPLDAAGGPATGDAARQSRQERVILVGFVILGIWETA